MKTLLSSLLLLSFLIPPDYCPCCNDYSGICDRDHRMISYGNKEIHIKSYETCWPVKSSLTLTRIGEGCSCDHLSETEITYTVPKVVYSNPVNSVFDSESALVVLENLEHYNPQTFSLTNTFHKIAIDIFSSAFLM